MITPRLGLFSLASLALLALNFALHPAPTVSPEFWLLLLLAVVLETVAVKTPGFGFLSSAFGAYLAIGLEFGPLAAAFVIALSVAVRGAFRGGDDTHRLLRDAVVDGFSALAAVTAAGLAPWAGYPGIAALAAVPVYLVFARVCPHLLAVEDEEFDLKEMAAYGTVRLQLSVGASIAGVGLSLLLHRGALALWILPLFLVFHFLAGQALAVRNTRRLLALERAQLEDQKRLAEVKARLEENRGQLAAKVEERVLVEEFAKLFARNLDLNSTLGAILDMAARIVKCQTVTVFLQQDGKLSPVAYRSPHQDRLRDHSLLALKEPLVEECWGRGVPIVGQRQHCQPPRLLEGELGAVALPIYQHGVLYLGDSKRIELSAQQRSLLTIIADQGSVALQAASNYQSLQEALSRHAESNQRLVDWNRRLDTLLNGARALSSSLTRNDVLERLQLLLEESLAHQAGIIVDPDGRPARAWPGHEGWNPTHLQHLCQVLEEQKRPLMFEDIAESRFGAPYAGYASVLAAPMLLEDRSLGTLLVCAQPAGQFDQSAADLIFLVAVQAAVVLRNCQLYREIQESQAQLIQSSKLAAVGQLAAGIAHELNSPLGAVVLQLQMAKRALTKERFDHIPKRIDTAETAALKAKEIIAKLLYYSREAGSARKLVDLSAIVRDALELLGSQIRQDGVEIVLDLQPTSRVMVNQNEIQQVVTNLVLNARDAVMEQNGKIEIATRSQGSTAYLRVKDSGPGIAGETQAKIFEPFFTTKEVGRGTGLGLSVSLQLVEAHQGTLTVESTLGQGAVFTMTLPTAE